MSVNLLYFQKPFEFLSLAPTGTELRSFKDGSPSARRGVPSFRQQRSSPSPTTVLPDAFDNITLQDVMTNELPSALFTVLSQEK